MAALLRNLLTLRFSLRAMLVVITIACVAIGWRANRMWRNQRALNSLSNSRINVLVGRGGEVQGPRLSFWSSIDVKGVSLLHIKPDAFNPDRTLPYDPVRNLWADVSRITPLEYLFSQCGDLPRRSDLGGTTPTSVREGIFFLCRFEGDSFEVSLEHMPRLKLLDLSHCEIDAKALSCLASLTDLESLTLAPSTSMPPDVICTIGGSQLRKLTLRTTDFKLSAADIRAIGRMTKLGELYISQASGPGISAQELKSLGQLRNLKRLYLDLDHNIRRAEIWDVKVELKRALPNCDITILGGRS